MKPAPESPGMTAGGHRIPVVPRAIRRNERPKRIENTYQGTRESRENTRPTVPAVEGTVMRKPEASPQYAVLRPKVRSPSIRAPTTSRAAPFRTYYASKPVP